MDEAIRNAFSIYSKCTLKSQDIHPYILTSTYIIAYHLFQSHIISISHFNLIVCSAREYILCIFVCLSSGTDISMKYKHFIKIL